MGAALGGSPRLENMKQAVVAVLLEHGRTLVIRRAPLVRLPGYWAPPSGRIEPGESQPEAVVREVREEIGLEVRAVGKVWECETGDGEYELHWWRVERVAGELRLDPREASDARWVDTPEFLGLEPTFAGDREFFQRVLPGLG